MPQFEHVEKIKIGKTVMNMLTGTLKMNTKTNQSKDTNDNTTVWAHKDYWR